MIKSENLSYNCKYFCLACGIGIIFTFIVLFLLAVITTLFDINCDFMPAIASIGLGAGAFSAGFITAKLNKQKGLIFGILCGIVIYAVCFISQLIFGSASFNLSSFSRLIIALCSGGIGGIAGVNGAKR